MQSTLGESNPKVTKDQVNVSSSALEGKVTGFFSPETDEIKKNALVHRCYLDTRF